MKYIYYLVILSMVIGLLIGCDVRKEIDYSNKIDNNKIDNNKIDNNKIDKPTKSIARIIFAGDTMMDGKVAMVMDEKGNDYPLKEFMPILDTADLVVLNLETAVGTSGNLMEKSYAFQTHPDRFSLFEPIKEKLLFNLANNHGMDAPLGETMMELDKLGLQYIGVGENQEAAFKPHLLDINGVSLAIIGVSRVIPHSSWTAGENHPGMATAYAYEPLVSHVKEWNDKVDHVIIFIHWGEELADLPNQHQVNLDNKLLEAGAKLIIGGHPHVIQEIKWREEGQLTAFSLGNFVFTTSRQAVANDLIALEIHLSKEKIEFAKVWPGRIQFGIVQDLSPREEAKGVLNRLRRLSPTIEVNDDGQISPIS